MTDPGDRIVLNGQRRGLVRSLVLPPLGFAVVWLVIDGLREGRVPEATWIVTSVMVGLAVIGAVVAFVPERLSFDDEGLRWSRLGRTRFFRWSDIEEIGIGRVKAVDGWDTPVARGLIGDTGHRLRASPMIGLNVASARSRYADPATRAYQRGFTGYEVNIPNSFDRPVEQIVDDLRARWQRNRAGTAG